MANDTDWFCYNLIGLKVSRKTRCGLDNYLSTAKWKVEKAIDVKL